MTEEIIIENAFHLCQRLEQERNDLQERLFTLADTYQETRNACKRLEQENIQMKSTLEEIREIVNNHSQCFYGYCEDCLYYQECEKANIECDCSKWHIDKINEVLQ